MFPRPLSLVSPRKPAPLSARFSGTSVPRARRWSRRSPAQLWREPPQGLGRRSTARAATAPARPGSAARPRPRSPRRRLSPARTAPRPPAPAPARLSRGLGSQQLRGHGAPRPEAAARAGRVRAPRGRGEGRAEPGQVGARGARRGARAERRRGGSDRATGGRTEGQEWRSAAGTLPGWAERAVCRLPGPGPARGGGTWSETRENGAGSPPPRKVGSENAPADPELTGTGRGVD